MAALSLATDLGMGQPMEQAIRVCLLSSRLASDLHLSPEHLAETYYLALLRFIGCTADAHEAAQTVGGDEIALRAALAPVIMGDPRELIPHLLKNFAKDQRGLLRLRLLAAALIDGTKGPKRSIAEHCEVAKLLVARMGVRAEVGEQVGSTFERWDGRGLPGLLSGDSIPMPARVVAVARDAEVFAQLGGWRLLEEVLTRRRAKAYDPAVVDALLTLGEGWLEEHWAAPDWKALVAAEPEPVAFVKQGDLDQVLRAFADFVDLKSPFTFGFSTAVAELTALAAEKMGLSEEEIRLVRRVGLVQDIGKAGIPSGILDKPSPLSPSEWERVRLHPYLSERILSHSTTLAPLAPLASTHHERLDGSGYHRGLPASAISRLARILAAGEAYQTLRTGTASRLALEPDDAEAQLKAEVIDGRLDREAVACVLAAAGRPLQKLRQSWPAGLTEREVEILRLICRGRTNRDVATALTISPKTVGRHIENIYGKIAVSSRAAAALFAMEHEILEP